MRPDAREPARSTGRAHGLTRRRALSEPADPAPRGFRVLPHTADVGFEAWGCDLGEVLCESARALFALIGPPATLTPDDPFEQTSVGVDREDALVRLLSDLLARFELEGRWVTSAACRRITRDENGDVRVTLVCAGGRVNRDDEPGLEELKAVTYHGLAIEDDGAGGVRARVYVDV